MEIAFIVNQKEYKINPATVPIETSLNTFLRSHLRLTGTKFMCLEGGCGACVVNISNIKTPTGETQSFAVNSCLWPVYSCDGLNVTTVEGIGNVKDGYHAIQKALWHFNGTQCGYCSPGMVMNMYSLLATNNGKVTMDQVENSFGGNICRCTGYRPILDAFKSLANDSCDIDIEDLTLDLCKLNDKNGSISCTKQCTKKCSLRPTTTMELMDDEGKVWIKPANATELFKTLTMKTMNTDYMLVAGNTAHGVYRRSRNIKVFIDVRNITELHVITVNEKEMVFGGNVTLTDMMNALQMAAKKYNFYSYAEQMAKHIDLVANVPVRSAGSIAGNLSIKHAHHEFPSDIFLILEAIGAQMNIASIDGTCRTHSLTDYLALDMRQKLIVNVILPKLPSNQFLFRSYKVMPRSQNAHAMINAAFLFEFDNEMAVKSCRICYGGVTPNFIHAKATEQLLIGVKDLFTNEVLQNVIKSLKNEINPDSVLPDPSPEYRQSLAIGLFYRFLLANAPSERIDDRFKSGAIGLERPLSSGSQTFESDEKLYPLTEAVPKYDGLIQVAGEAQYANDHFSSFRFDEELWAAFVYCTNVHSKMVSIDASKALKLPGVHSFLSAKDIPGINSFMPFNSNIFGIIEKEELFLSMDSEVLFHGQPCGMILAKTMDTALAAADLVEIGYEKLNSKGIVPCLSHWLEHNENVPLNDSITEIFPSTVADPSKSFVQIGNQKKIEGDFEIGAQYHFTMENQTTFCYPNEDGGLDVCCATQYLDVTQVAISKLLNIQQSKVNIFVKRIGSGYGGKLTACASPACAAALGAFLTRQPVRFVLSIESNMRTLGKRYACAFNYNMNIDSVTGHISTLNATLTEDFGYTLNDDVSYFTMDSINRTCYARTDAWKITINKIKTDAPSSTWCRGPGALEGVSFQETIMEQIAREINLDPAQIRLNNLPNDSKLKIYFPQFLKDTEYYERKSKINEFNKLNRWHKKGIAVSIMHYPVMYISANASYVAIYHSDGTVAISHGGTEIGQGIHTKVAQVAAHTLGIPYNFITVTQTTTLLAPNNNLTGGSITSESVCAATKRACEKILERMKPVRDKMPKASWLELVQACYSHLIDMNEMQTFTALEGKNYAVIGCACSEVEVDVLTGNMQITRVDIVEDTGQSMSPLIDVGQIEGAFMMGVGYWLIEKLDYNRQTGELLTNRSWNYKVPGAKDIPIDFRIKFLQNVNSDGILRSKTTGEQALCLAISVPFALRHAMDSIRADNGITEKWFRMGSGNTPDVAHLAFGNNVDDFKLK